MDYAEQPAGDQMDYEEAPYDQNGEEMDMDDVPVTQEDAWAVVSEKVPPPSFVHDHLLLCLSISHTYLVNHSCLINVQ
jgi:hypothetical protein